MPDINKANRQVCDVDIRILQTMAPYLNFETANTTTAGVSSENVYAMAKGARRITFQDPMTGTMTIEAQVVPFKFWALLSDGTIESKAVYAASAKVKCATGGELPLKVTGGTVVAGTVFVYPEGEFGDPASVIDGTFASDKFTASAEEKLSEGKTYEVAFMVNRDSGVKRVAFNNKKLPKDYYITMKTVDKDEQDNLVPYVLTAYKASIQRNFELSFSSEGDPASVTLTFDLMEDKDGNVLDMIEISDDITVNAGE